jgi:tetratricopeptide (TPR) repeat protein
MCYWGLALALGNKINAPENGLEYKDAQMAIQKALSLSVYETAEERDYINALSLRFKHAPKRSTKVAPFSCHLSSAKHDESTEKEINAYAQSMKAIAKKYPNDNDAKNFYAYALFNKISWNFWDNKHKINPLTPEIINTLKSSINQDQLSIGGNHYYIHVIEQSSHPENALESSSRLQTLVQGSEHLVHMPAHIYFLTGRYHEATASNLQAVETYKQYNKTCLQQGFQPEINFLYFHNYDFLRTTAAMEGRKQLALDAARQIVNEPFSVWQKVDPTGLQWFIPIPYFVEARFQLWDEILNEPIPNANYQYALGMWLYTQGLALANTGKVTVAEQQAIKLEKIIKKGPIDKNLGEKGYTLLKIANELLAGTLSTIHGNEKSTIAHLKAAVKLQQEMGYHEPPDWYFPVKEALGNAYLKYGHPNDAKNMFEQVLKQYPKNGWALFGLALSLRKLGEEQKAAAVDEEFRLSWKYADIPAPMPMF